MTTKPIAFEIEVKPRGSPSQLPAIKKKLEQYGSEAAPSLEDIEQKLKKAETIRKEEYARKIGNNTDEKLSKV